jgi:hypothetical protein
MDVVAWYDVLFLLPSCADVYSVCRKKKAVHKTTTTDDKRLQSTLKRLGVNTIPGIEEVNIFQDESVIHFVNPKGMLLFCDYLWSSGIENKGNMLRYYAALH